MDNLLITKSKRLKNIFAFVHCDIALFIILKIISSFFLQKKLARMHELHFIHSHKIREFMALIFLNSCKSSALQFFFPAKSGNDPPLLSDQKLRKTSVDSKTRILYFSIKICHGAFKLRTNFYIIIEIPFHAHFSY